MRRFLFLILAFVICQGCMHPAHAVLPVSAGDILMSELRIEIDDDAAISAMANITARVKDPRPVLINFHGYMMRQTALTFRQLRRGGTFRGVTWAPFKDQYTRKTDGAVVPAHGGTPKLDVTKAKSRGLRVILERSRVKYPNPNVLGKMRPSGSRITQSSSLLVDTGQLRRSAGQHRVWEDGNFTLRMATRGLSYAPRQHALRPILFYNIPEDHERLVEMALNHLDKEDKS